MIDELAPTPSPAEQRIAFPSLSDEQLTSLTQWGDVRDVAAGDVLFSEGDRGVGFFVVLEGSVEILEHSSG